MQYMPDGGYVQCVGALGDSPTVRSLVITCFYVGSLDPVVSKYMYCAMLSCTW